jgi:hypothetical protein
MLYPEREDGVTVPVWRFLKKSLEADLKIHKFLCGKIAAVNKFNWNNLPDPLAVFWIPEFFI